MRSLYLREGGSGDPPDERHVARFSAPLRLRSGALRVDRWGRQYQADHEEPNGEGDVAGASVLTGAVLDLRLDALTDGRTAFINVTRSMLLNGGQRCCVRRSRSTSFARTSTSTARSSRPVAHSASPATVWRWTTSCPALTPKSCFRMSRTSRWTRSCARARLSPPWPGAAAVRRRAGGTARPPERASFGPRRCHRIRGWRMGRRGRERGDDWCARVRVAAGLHRCPGLGSRAHVGRIWRVRTTTVSMWAVCGNMSTG